MELIRCSQAHLDLVSDLYAKVVEHLKETINYPKWSEDYPCRESVREAIENGWQYVCMEDHKALGAVVLNDNPGGNYEAGHWKRELKRGEYLVIHTLAVEPSAGHQGIGGYLVDRCIEIGLERGYKAIRLDVVPENLPAINLYKRKGFTFAGEEDLLRNIEEIPKFALYELNLTGIFVQSRRRDKAPVYP